MDGDLAVVLPIPGVNSKKKKKTRRMNLNFIIKLLLNTLSSNTVCDLNTCWKTPKI